MAQDPALFPTTPEGRTKARLAALERRVAVLERNNTAVLTGSGPPPAALDPPVGVLYIDTTTPRVYVRLSTTTWANLTSVTFTP